MNKAFLVILMVTSGLPVAQAGLQSDWAREETSAGFLSGSGSGLPDITPNPPGHVALHNNAVGSTACHTSYTQVDLKDDSPAHTVLTLQTDGTVGAYAETAMVALLTDHGVVGYRVELSFDILGNRQFVASLTQVPPSNLTCDEARAAGFPDVAPSAFFAAVEQLGLGSQSTHGFIYQAGRVRLLSARPAADGWAEYSLLLVPDFVDLSAGFGAFTAYSATMDPFRGTWDEIYGKPSAMR